MKILKFILVSIIIGFIILLELFDFNLGLTIANFGTFAIAVGLTLMQIIGGIIALGVGAEFVVRSSSNLANIYKVSGYFIGFTIVALGTSLPELASTIQAIDIDSIEIALGNIIGSNIANILLILGVVSIIHPIILSKKIPAYNVLIITIGVFFILYYMLDLDKLFQISSAIFLVIILFIYLYWQYKIEKRKSEVPKDKIDPSIEQFSQILSYILLFIGILLLVFGSRYFVIGSKNLADYFKISEAVIGVTLVAFGTSMPELATGILAAAKKQTGIAVGTILGSNIYNIVGILAVILFLKSGEMGILKPTLVINYIIMIFVTFIFVLKIKINSNILGESSVLNLKTGIFFIVLYILYIIYNYFYTI